MKYAADKRMQDRGAGWEDKDWEQNIRIRQYGNHISSLQVSREGKRSVLLITYRSTVENRVFVKRIMHRWRVMQKLSWVILLNNLDLKNVSEFYVIELIMYREFLHIALFISKTFMWILIKIRCYDIRLTEWN